MRIACLCVTHERPQWIPWVIHQFEKQEYVDARLFIIDSSERFVDCSGENVIHVSSTSPEISPKRTHALRLAQLNNFDAIAWFDDDDWSNPERLVSAAMDMREHRASIVGHRVSWLINTRDERAVRWDSPEPIIFNGALYKLNAVPMDFAGLPSGEDTEWQRRVFARNPSAWITPVCLSAWMCHEQNITNRASRIIFEDRHGIEFDEFEREMLRSGKL